MVNIKILQENIVQNFKATNQNDCMFHADDVLIFLNVLLTILASLITRTLCCETILYFRNCHYMTIGKNRFKNFHSSRTKYLALCFKIEWNISWGKQRRGENKTTEDIEECVLKFFFVEVLCWNSCSTRIKKKEKKYKKLLTFRLISPFRNCICLRTKLQGVCLVTGNTV